MRAWYDVAIPREDILRGELDDSMFAADLADVLKQRGPLEYRDPERFFQQTYPTAGLINLLAQVIKRLATGRGDAVIQLQTPFGGGKTHALISLYHLFQHGSAHRDAPLVSQTLERAGMDELPEVRIVTFVGTEADATQGKTPWGELAEQLGRYDVLKEQDQRRRAPGRERLHELLSEQPTLILMDELAAYAVNARDFVEQVMLFCQHLTEAVKSIPQCVLVATLPSSAPYGEQGDQRLRQLEMIFGRVQAIYTPVEGDEFFHVIRQRLFKEIADQTEVRRTVDAFYELYQRHADQLPDKVRTDSYRQRMRAAYPFHPEVIDILYENWSTFSTFQRTRGVLKLLGEVLSNLYQQRNDIPLILPVHINLRHGAIQQEFLRHVGNGFAAVIQRDIVGNAEQVDKQLGAEYAPYQVASGLATAIFFGSFSAGEHQGISEAQLRLATLRPNLYPTVIGEALHQITSRLWYLHHENGLYQFRLQPNLNRIVLDKQERISREMQDEALRALVSKHAGKDTVQVLLFPDQPSDIADTRELKLAILEPALTRQASRTEEKARSLFDFAGETPRVYRNTLFMLVADADELTKLQNMIKQRLAYEAVREDKSTWQSLSDGDRHTVNQRLQEFNSSELFLLLSTYRHIALMRDKNVTWYSLGMPTSGTHETLSQRATKFLRNEEILLNQISPRMLLDKVVRADAEQVDIQEIIDAFYRYTHLPMIASEDVGKRAVQQGVLEGKFAVRAGEKVYYKESIPLSVLQYQAMLLREPPPAPMQVGGTQGTESGGCVQEGETGEPTQPQRSPQPKPSPSPTPTYERYRLRATVPSEKIYELLQGVITPLQKQGLNFPFTIELEVQGDIPKNTIDLTIAETLVQIEAQIEVQEKE